MGRRTEANERGHEYIPYGLVSLIALVWIGGMLKFLADGEFPAGRPTEVDGLLVGGLLVLYALTIPLVIRIGRAARRDESGALTDGRRLAGQLDGMPVVVWTTDRKLRLTGSAGGGLVSLAVPPGRPRVPMEELFREGRSTRALVH